MQDRKEEHIKKMSVLKYMMIPIGIFNLITMSLVIAILAYSYYIRKDEKTDISSITQIGSDWSLKPFVRLNVRPYGCLVSEEPAFSVEWKGTESGC